MASREDIQGFIDRLENGAQGSREVEKDLWVVQGESNGAQIVVNYAPPVVVFRVNVMELPKDAGKRTDLMQRLLELNVTDLVHGSYGIEGSTVVLTGALELENLDFSEFQATVDSINLALGSHLATFASYQE